MRINHNIQALNAYSKLSKNQFATGKALEKLSSGLRINRAADDAAGLAISEKMRGQIRGLQQAEKNAMDGISLIQTAEGALAEVHDMLSRMRELAVQAANGTLTPSDRGVIQDEINQLREQIDRVGNDTQFNTKKLLNGSLSENADIRSLYGTVNYSKQGAGLRDVAVDPASILPEDVYSLNVVTTSKIVKTIKVNGTDDPYKTGLENILLSPDSQLPKGSYAMELTSSMKTFDAKYDNATNLAFDAAFPKDKPALNGTYSIEYDKTSQKVSFYYIDNAGVKKEIQGTTTAIDPTKINQEVEFTVDNTVTVPSSDIQGEKFKFQITDANKDAKIVVERNISEDANVKNVNLNDSLLEDGYYLIESDGTIAKLYQTDKDGNKIGAFIDEVNIGATATPATPATTFGTATAMTASSGSPAVHPTIQGTYTGLAIQTLTVKWDNAASKFSYSTDGVNFTDITPATTVTVDGMTIDVSTATGLSADAEWTQSLSPASAGTPATSKFPKYGVEFDATATAGKASFKQGTEYKIEVKQGATRVGVKDSIRFGDEAINLREGDGTVGDLKDRAPLGVTIDFTNSLADYVKRGGKLPTPPATGTPFYSFSVDELNRTSVILKDSSQKVIAHQFVDNDRKYVELKGTGITFSTGVLSNNETATNIDLRQTLQDASVTFQIGTNAGEIVALGIGDIRTKALGIDKFKLTDETSASNAIAIIDSAIDKVSTVRSKLGAYQNRMEHTVNNITQSTENLTAAESRIRDADMAKEMTEFTKLNIINQSATAMLAQANQLPQGVLQLLKG